MAAADSSVSGIAQRYATAIHDLAVEAHVLDAVAGDLKGLTQLIDESPDLTRLVRSPVFSRDEQGRAMAAVLDRVGVNALTRQFVLFLATQRRLFALPGISRTLSAMIAKARGEMTASVVSAFALKDHQVAALKATLKASFGREVSLDIRVDPTLIGGLIIQAGSRMIDSSLRTKLAALAQQMKGA